MKENRGFASMGLDMQRRIASLGGKAAHAQGRAHEFSQEEAREAGRKGGKTHSKEHLSRIGKLGAMARIKKHGAR